MMRLFFLPLFFCFFVPIVYGVHFLGGTITWHPVNNSLTGPTIPIIITQIYHWTYYRVNCTYNMSVNHDLIIFQPTYGSLETQLLICVATCPLGYSPPLIRPYCMNASVELNTVFGQRSDIVNLTLGDDFTVAFISSAWRALKHASSAGWVLSSNIKLIPRSDNGRFNSAPEAVLRSPIYIYWNQSMEIHIPVTDPDGDIFRCRWSRNNLGIDECGGACPPTSLPQNTTIYPNCTIVITGEALDDWHAVTIMIEDFINETSTVPLSAVPIQFLVNVVLPPNTTTTTTTTTEKPKKSSIELPLLITAITISSLILLLLCCCCCCYCLRLCCFILLAHRNPRAKPILYPIDHCTNHDCYWNDSPSPLSTPDYSPPKKSNNHRIYTTLNKKFSAKKTRVAPRWKSSRPSFSLIRVRRVFVDRTLLDNDSNISVVEDTIRLQ